MSVLYLLEAPDWAAADCLSKWSPAFPEIAGDGQLLLLSVTMHFDCFFCSATAYAFSLPCVLGWAINGTALTPSSFFQFAIIHIETYRNGKMQEVNVMTMHVKDNSGFHLGWSRQFRTPLRKFTELY